MSTEGFSEGADGQWYKVLELSASLGEIAQEAKPAEPQFQPLRVRCTPDGNRAEMKGCLKVESEVGITAKTTIMNLPAGLCPPEPEKVCVVAVNVTSGASLSFEISKAGGVHCNQALSGGQTISFDGCHWNLT